MVCDSAPNVEILWVLNNLSSGNPGNSSRVSAKNLIKFNIINLNKNFLNRLKRVWF